jgi:hypothetical protein
MFLYSKVQNHWRLNANNDTNGKAFRVKLHYAEHEVKEKHSKLLNQIKTRERIAFNLNEQVEQTVP